MKTFRIKADATFSAEDIMDAFRTLAAHFQALADHNHGLEGSIIESGEIEIAPVGKGLLALTGHYPRSEQ